MMKKYFAKARDWVNAIQFTGENIEEIREFVGKESVKPSSIPDKYRIYFQDHSFRLLEQSDWVLKYGNDPTFYHYSDAAFNDAFELVDVKNNIDAKEGIRYNMTNDQPCQIDCRVTDCKYYKGGGVCSNISPAITLNQDRKFVCWSYKKNL